MAIEHFAVSLGMAAPLVVILNRLGHRAAPAVGLVNGGTSWFVVNTLALPWIFDQPTPWQVGSQDRSCEEMELASAGQFTSAQIEVSA